MDTPFSRGAELAAPPPFLVQGWSKHSICGRSERCDFAFPLFAEANYDIHEFCRRLSERQAISGYCVVKRGSLVEERIALWADEPVGVERLWKELAVRGTASPKLWMDAYLAAFALAGRYSMVTTDAGFRQFRGLDLLVLG